MKQNLLGYLTSINRRYARKHSRQFIHKLISPASVSVKNKLTKMGVFLPSIFMSQITPNIDFSLACLELLRYTGFSSTIPRSRAQRYRQLITRADDTDPSRVDNRVDFSIAEKNAPNTRMTELHVLYRLLSKPH
jgi:hypothetical protein